MATEVLKQLSIVYNNARTYLAAHTLGLHESALGYDMIMRLYMGGSKSGYATLNDAAKAELFPSETARPHQLDVKFASYAQFDRADNSVAFSVSGEELHRASGLGTSATHVDESFTGATIDGMTKTTEMRFTLHSNSTVCAVCVISADLILHFWQYACAANAAGNGIANAAVSNAAPYQGESITFTAQLTLSAKQQETSQLASIGKALLSAGVLPNGAQLAAMGMTKAQAQDYLTAQGLASAASSGTGSGSGAGAGPGSSSGYDNGSQSAETIKALQTALGVTADGKWGPATQAAAQKKWGTTSADEAAKMSCMAWISPTP